ncbi:hypothetical protein CCC_00968 [Paramagnetospirillum magnetotacticum MS-1]|uniref:EAL domain-containing protein n=1 Tax=Paramagnetospirillum magnetotacticum MS-1 TaxID=272627 RepID=A0A0C2U8T4_PARME|nr:hypothetical protein [Paramagnetospirillum magnetotacticum]KIL97907.1 hypothetical protein CCC_00968 [Paramagnetospirillum magnetotacticum MS-1]
MSKSIFTDRHAFETLAASLLKSNPSGSFGKLHVVTVDHGDNEAEWARILPKAAMIAESIIGSRLSHDDVCLKIGQGQYMMLFPSMSEQEGLVRAVAIASEIKGRLFGETGGGIDVTAKVLPLTRLQQRGAVTAAEAMDNVLTRHSLHNGIDLDVVYQPVWSASRQEVVGNRARIRRHFNGQDMFENAVLFGGEQDPLAVDGDAVLLRSASHLARIGGVLFLPQAINDHAMTDVVQIAAQIRPMVELRKGPLVIELAGAVASIAHGRLRQTIATILDCGAKVAVRTVPDVDTAKFLAKCGVNFLCLNVAQIRMAGLTPSAILALATVFAHETRGLGFQHCLWNSTVPNNVKRAVDLGFELFSGPVVGEHGEVAVAPHALPSGKLFS